MPAKPLTVEQLADAGRLKALFTEWQRVRRGEKQPWSQDWASDQLGFGQSAMNQYLNGKIPLNPEAAAKFSKLLGRSVADFSLAVAKEISGIAQGVDYGSHVKPQEPAAREPAAAYVVITPAQAVATLAESLLALNNPESREAAGLFLQKMAADPRGRWAALLVGLIETESATPVNITGEGLHQPKALHGHLKLADTAKQGRVSFGAAQTAAESPVMDNEESKKNAAAGDKSGSA